MKAQQLSGIICLVFLAPPVVDDVSETLLLPLYLSIHPPIHYSIITTLNGQGATNPLTLPVIT